MARSTPRFARTRTATSRAARSGRRRTDEILVGAPLQRVWHVHVRLSREERVTTETLASELDVTTRTIKRDLDFMRDRLGLPIEWDPGEHSYVYTRACDTLPLLRIDAREALALALAGRLFDGWHGSPLGRMFADLVRRIAPVFGGAVTMAVDSLDTALTSPRAAWHDEIEHLLTLLEAILGRRVLNLDYAKPGASRVEKRLVHPLHLAEFDGRWLLIAHDPVRKALRHFVLKRIRQATPTDATFEPPEDFDAARTLRGCMGAFAGDKEQEVRIALDAHAAVYARETPWHPSQKLAPRPDGRVELSLRLNHLADAKSAVLRWGRHAEVLSPAELRDDVREEVQAAAERYQRRPMTQESPTSPNGTTASVSSSG